MAKVSSKGQIWLPVDVKDFLKIYEGELIYFNVDQVNRVVWLSKEKENYTHIEYPLLSKNQLTIPAKIREILNINPEDDIIFGYDDNHENVYFKKKLELLKCPVCNGEGKISGHICIVCREKGVIEKEFVMQELTSILTQTIKYKVGIAIISTEVDKSNGIPKELLFPKVSITSRLYPQDILDTFQDYYQVRIIEDFTPKSLSEPDKFMNPTDVLLEEILSYLKTDEAKNKVYKWFRYERNVFSGI